MCLERSPFYGKMSPERVVETARRHGARSVRVFGSVGRGTHTDESDLLVEFEPGCNLFDLIELRRELEVTLGRNVDIVMERSLSPYIREKVLREAMPL
jgi:predicted nucleotidyltransferase